MIHVHHVGYLVKKLDKAQNHFAALGFTTLNRAVYDEIRGVDILFMKKDDYVVELVMPKAETSIVSNLMKNRKNSPYHICYSSDDYENDLSVLENSGFMRMDDPKPAPAIDNHRVCFLMSPQIGIVELLEGAK